MKNPSFRLPKYSEIPSVGLFLEQVAKYINECLAALGEPELTGSMISNYVKKGIITNPVKKTYSRDQIAYLIFIAIAKNILSLEDINCFLLSLKPEVDTEKAYAFFSEEFERILCAVYNNEKLTYEDKTAGSVDEKIRSLKDISVNICITAAHKIYLDNIFKNMRAPEDRTDK